MLKINNLESGYSKVSVLKNINLDIKPKEVILIIGSNGAGKSTLLKTIFGFNKVKNGEIHYNGLLINNMPVFDRVKMGISYVFQDRRIFGSRTVEDNLRLAFINSGTIRFKESVENIYNQFPILFEKKKTISGILSGGEQQQLAIGRALIQRPKLILFDEPSAGLSPKFAEEFFLLIKDLAIGDGITCVLVEHRIKEALKISNRVVGLKDGNIKYIEECKDILYNNKMDLITELFVS